MNNLTNARKLRLESLEERTLLAVVAGSEESAAALIAQPEPTSAPIVVSSLTYSALQSAINSAAAGSTITFAKSGTITLTGTQLVISKSITIDASSVGGVTIDANQESRVFYVSGGTRNSPVELISLTITGGYICDNDGEYDGGGGIYNVGSLTMMSCTVSNNNRANGWGGGGGIHNVGSLTMMSCTVSNNRENGWGGGGGICNDDSASLSLTNCVVMNCLGTYGGGIHNRHGTVTITNTYVGSNTVTVSGGGICNVGSLTMMSCTVSGNTAPTAVGGEFHCGGGILNQTGTATLINSTVLGNRAFSGGGLSNVDGGTLILVNSTVAANSGGITNDCWYSSDLDSSLVLYNSIVAGNYRGYSVSDIIINDEHSGGIYAYNTLSTFNGWTESSNCLTYNPSLPLFTDAANGDYTLAENSQAIDKGNNSYISGYDTDLAGKSRIYGGIVDLGAYEFQSETWSAPNISVETITIPNTGNHIVTGEEVKLVATIQENTNDHDLSDYELKDMAWTIEKLNETTNEYEVVKTDIVAATSNRWAKVTLSSDKWEIHYTGWQPEEGDQGKYLIFCDLTYKVKGSHWSARHVGYTYKSTARLDNVEVEVSEQPDISVENITISCNDPDISKNHPDWGAVVGKNVKLVATIQENTKDHNLSDYELKNMVWKIEKLDADGNVVKTVKTDTVSATSDRWAKVTLSSEKWEIHYTGWLPEKGDHGSYKVACTLNYKVKGTNWVTTLFSETFSSSQTLDDAKVDVAEYAVAWARPKWSNKGMLINEFNDDISTLSYKSLEGLYVTRSWYEGTYLKSTGSQKVRQTLIEGELRRNRKEGQEEIGDVTYFVPSNSCFIVFGAAGKNGTIQYSYDLLASDECVLSTTNREKGCHAIVFEYPDSEFMLKQDAEVFERAWNSWQVKERMTLANPSYNNNLKDSWYNPKWIQTGYFIERQYYNYNSDTGLDAFCLSPVDNTHNPVLLFPGTDTRAIESTGISFLSADILSDLNPDGVGYDQYVEKRSNLEGWSEYKNSQGYSVDVYGYSLGAALSQWFVANYKGLVGNVELYNAPGISREAVDYYKNRFHSVQSITYHIAIGDLVSMAGEAYLPGTVKLYTNSNENYSCTDYHLAPMVTQYAFVRTRENGVIKYKNTAQLKDTITAETFGSYWFNYDHFQKYYDTFIEIPVNLTTPKTSIGIHTRLKLTENLYIRGTTEYIRSHVDLAETLRDFDGALVEAFFGIVLLDPDLVREAAQDALESALSFVVNLIEARMLVDLPLSHNWTLKKINQNLCGSGNVKGRPTVTIQTPDGISMQAFISYAGYGLDKISVDPRLYYVRNQDYLKIGNASLWLPNTDNGTLSFTAIDGSSPTDVYRDTDYMLSGNVTARFGSFVPSKKMAEFKISSIKASSWDISDINLHYDGKSVANLNTTNRSFTATNKGKRLSGNVDLTLTVYDYKLNSDGTDYILVRSDRTFSNSTMTFKSGLISDNITITNNSGNDHLVFQYAEGKSPTLKIGSTIYSYNSSTNEWYTTASKPAAPQLPQAAILPDPLPTGLSGSVTANASGYEISVKIPKSTFDRYSLVSFYLDSNNSGFDGDYITSLAKSDMVLKSGYYTCSFDLSGTDVEPGTYYLYAHGDFEAENQSVYSNKFTLTQPLQALTLSETAYQFSDTNIGIVNDSIKKQFTITNSGETDATFAITMSEDSDYLDFLCTAQLSDGSYLTTPTVTLSPGETLSLDVYFVPQTVGDKGAVIKLVSDLDDSELGTISLTGKALEMLPADIGTSTAGAAVSPQSVCVGEAFDVSCTIFNNSANTADCSSVSFYVSQNASNITSGTLIGTVDVSEWILSGESKTVTLSLESFPQLSAGNYYVGWVVESENDSDLSNNSAVLDRRITVSDTQTNRLAAPTITTGARGVYVSYGANRHQIQWNTVKNAAGYVVKYSENGTDWVLVSTQDTSIVVNDLTYGADVTYLVRAQGNGSYADSEWSASKTFNVCPMDINNDGDISGADRTLLSNAWLAEEGDDEYQYCADINGDGDISSADRTFLSNNWLGEVGDIDLNYPKPKQENPVTIDLAVLSGGNVQLSNGVISLTTGKIKNNGTGTAVGGYKIKIYASTDTSISSSDILLGTYTVNTPLQTGQSTTLSYHNISANALTAGRSYYIGWIVSDVNGETVTSNNTAYCSSKITVPAPALAPDLTATVGGSITMTSDGKFTLSYVTIKNVGNGDAPAGFKISIYASSDTSITTADTLLTSFTNNTDLPAGESMRCNFDDISVEGLTAGQSYYIGWIISDVEGETVTSNNTAYCSSKITVPVPALAPDITATVGGSVSTISGGKFTLSNVTIKNVGNGDAPAGFRIDFYASTDTSITTADTLLFAGTTNAGLEAGESITFGVPDISVEGLTAGQSYYIGWIISDVEGETVTSNNTAYCSSKITVPVPALAPDITATVGGSVSTISGGKFTLSNVTIKNVGNGDAPAGFKVNVYASTDTSITSADTLLTTYTVNDTLAVGKSKTVKIIDIPFPVEGLAVGGSYYIGWIVSDVAGEAVLDNNAAYCKTQLTVPAPDLAASNGGTVTTPSSFKLTLKTGTIKNAGKGDAPAGFRINVYASTDTSITTDDILLTSHTVTEALAAGKSATFTIEDISTTKLAVGQYYIGWIVDNVSGESVLTNNKAYCTTKLKVTQQNWVVNTIADPASWSTTDSVVSLREAVSRASNGDLITFADTLAGKTITLNGSQINIDKSVTIDASSIGGITIDADGKNRVFYITGGTNTQPVVMTRLTIQGGDTRSYEDIADRTGAGFYSKLATIVMTDCLITDNYSYYGGGFFSGGGTATITNCVISNNSAAQGGGFANAACLLTMTNCSVIQNYGYWGGIFNTGNVNDISLKMINCTVAGNSSNANPGAGLYNHYTNAYLYNTVIAENTSPTSNSDVCNENGSIYAYNSISSFTDWTTSSNCLIYNSSKPLFTNAAKGNYTLAANSQAINKGNNSYISGYGTDLAGNARIVNGTVDIGAYEYQGATSAALPQFNSPSLLTGDKAYYGFEVREQDQTIPNAFADADLSFLPNSWFGEADDDDLTTSKPLAADIVFAEFASADIGVDLDVF